MYDDIKKKFSDLETELQNPAVAQDPAKLAKVSKAHADLRETVGLIREWEKTDKEINEAKEMAANETDTELKEVALSELDTLGRKAAELKDAINRELNPADPRDKKDVIMEIRAGTGGDESALFAADLFRMYARYAERMGWKIDILNTNRIGIGGFKEIVFEVHGKDVFRYLKYEGGTHRVQRVPETEKQGRIHTSAATVAVLPEAEEIDFELKLDELRIDTYAATARAGRR